MTIPVIEQADLELLATAYPDLDFTDPERQAVLLENATKDVQAAPGSGKTTLLAAKLFLLSQKWCHSNRGICVLSHTNVAGEEIKKRLSVTPTGAKLLDYPHFIGTIHAFVNHFLALPLLRSQGSSVDVIDNDIFAARATSLLPRKFKLHEWVKRNPNQGPDAIKTLHYEGADLKLAWATGKLPGEGSASHRLAYDLKNDLAGRGVFCHDDMFAFAERLLRQWPDITKRLSWRFPLLLIDEMQDTSWAQEDLLTRLFDDTVVIQRYGDRNQRILSSAKDSNKLSFPKAEFLSVKTTKRFPKSIAEAVSAVQEHGEAVEAAQRHNAPSPVLMLYETPSATSVIEQFGKIVLRTLPDETLRLGAVKAICARKQGAANADPGRHLMDYWPSYMLTGPAVAGEESAFRLLSAPPAMGVSHLNLDRRARDVKRAILLALRKAGNKAVADVRDASGLIRALEAAGEDSSSVRLLCHELAVGRGHAVDATSWSATLDLMYTRLTPLLPAGLNRIGFHALPIFEVPQATPTAALPANECVARVGDRQVRVQIGTVASVKGETHVATLVLEAHGGLARCFDLQTALGNISDGNRIDARTTDTVRGLYRNLYVAMSRPTHLLCLAMNRDRAKKQHVDNLAAKGWTVVIVPP
ncbi:UvrD-helicase domain-containing protein [Geomonas ferrireducens]|uniref:UvrD-helicase domain-containing protein n=1 Tax=Geomonas ferrireducens TaxID=2570227 RepID=UPI0010A84B54|nr:UvrD-helicase domain-containing protein [Geomonas ferrireducens]